MQVAGIQALEVNSLSARAASITFDYAGSLGRLQKELDQNGFVFGRERGDLCAPLAIGMGTSGAGHARCLEFC